MLEPLTLEDDELRALDEELARLARCNVRDRLALGVALHRLGKGFQELGFRSFAMYVRERASQGARWCGDTRALARRLEDRPVIRAALVSGRIGWSMAELLARHAGPDEEAELLAAIEGATVREVREALRTAGGEVVAEDEDVDAYCTVGLPVTASELLALEATKAAIEHVNGGVVEPGHWLECLVFEGASTLFGKRPDLASHYERFAPTARRERGLVEEPVPARRAVEDEALVEEPVDADDPLALDAVVRDVGARLASRDLWLGALLSRFMLARGWVALGYASEQSYFDERLGLARSTARGRITLARRVEHLERLGDAVRDGEVGYEQASLIARVAGPDTVDAWVARATARTYVHLAEEVRAVELLARVEGAPARHLAPPDDDELEAVIAFERAVLSGELLASAAREAGADSDVRNDAVQMSGGAAEDAGAVQMSVGLPEPRNRFIAVRARDEVILDYRRLEAVHRATGSPSSFATFLVAAFWSAWGERFFEGNRWKAIHDRDRHRCVSPVCESRNATNHHVRYRAHGGGDEAENQITLCEFCHLEGEHGGRLRVRGTASHLEWWIGRTPVLKVEGREVTQRR